MKENVLDVLMYLFETYIDAEEEPEPDQNELRDELSRAGFGDTEIDRAHLIEPDGADMRQREIVWSHPAYARKCCFVRNDSEIICVSLAAEP